MGEVIPGMTDVLGPMHPATLHACEKSAEIELAQHDSLGQHEASSLALSGARRDLEAVCKGLTVNLGVHNETTVLNKLRLSELVRMRIGDIKSAADLLTECVISNSRNSDIFAEEQEEYLGERAIEIRLNECATIWSCWLQGS